MRMGEVWDFFTTEAVKPAVNEMRLTKPGRGKDSEPV